MDSFGSLYERWFPDVYCFLYKMTGYEKHLAEELCQETFFRAYLAIHRFRGECHIRTWLFGIAKNVYFTYLRKKKNAFLIEHTDIREGSLGAIDELAAQRELIRSAVSIIGGFRKNMAEVMLLRLIGEIPYAQIGAKLKISEGSAKVIFCRGKALLKERLKEEYGYEI